MKIPDPLGTIGIFHGYQTLTKNNPFCTSSQKLFLKNVNTENNWVGHSVIKPVEAESLKKKKRHLRSMRQEKWQLLYGYSGIICSIEGIKCQKEESR